jgi:hypothetical protein
MDFRYGEYHREDHGYSVASRRTIIALDRHRSTGGTISYVGRITCKIENPSFRLSNYLWGEAKFPLIIFLDGFRTNLEITEFKEMFGYKPNW